MPPQVNAPAPNFAIPDQNDRIVSLGDLRGQWVVLYFYPKDDTPGCTIEACEFTSGLEGFGAINAKVLGVSADSPQSHRDFIAKFKLAIDLLSDESHRMLEAYGVWGEREWQGKKYMGISRQTFIINPQGDVVHHWPTVTAKGHAEEVKAKLKELQGR